MDKIIKTDRLEIKPYQDTDQKVMIELLTNKVIKKMTLAIMECYIIVIIMQSNLKDRVISNDVC
ncbi:hypothetical protein [Lachnoclostridium phytofermentans]|uniref:hypothetical protein n=1 Tax=Lachnoclostridium phytofermentans TaxID=66219 RepID=UPI0003061803|nr:hypothetical protein [Lachnoclostridium phytofermentans]